MEVNDDDDNDNNDDKTKSGKEIGLKTYQKRSSRKTYKKRQQMINWIRHMSFKQPNSKSRLASAWALAELSYCNTVCVHLCCVFSKRFCIVIQKLNKNRLLIRFCLLD